MTALPHIDEHSVDIAASPEKVWEALAQVAERFGRGWAGETFAAALGAEHRRINGEVPTPGSTIVGFQVARAEAPVELALAGTHRFSRYALIFRIDDLDGRSHLRAETRAEFPGPHGRVYRALVIGSRAHVLVVRRLLDSVKRRAEAR